LTKLVANVQPSTNPQDLDKYQADVYRYLWRKLKKKVKKTSNRIDTPLLFSAIVYLLEDTETLPRKRK
jgi:hypothetical protein